MVRAASENRRRRACWWLLGLLFALSHGSLVCAQSQYESAREAMGPVLVTGPVLGNRIAAPDVGRFPQPAPKARVLALPCPPAVEQAAPPTLPVGGPPTAPAAVEATQGRPLPPAAPQAGPGPLPAPVAVPQTTAAPPTAPGPDQVLITGERFRYTSDGTEVQGNVELKYQDLTLRGGRAQLDQDRIWGAFPGSFSLDAKLYKALGKDLRINLDTQDWTATDASAEVEPDFFGQYVAAALYLRAQQVSGGPSGVIGLQGVGTSCDLWPGPHWMLRSNRVTYLPGDRVIFQRPTLYMFGHRLIRYPWDLVLSLRREENRFLPEVGQNQVEGYYAKFAYGYVLNDENSGFLRLNLTQLRGVGFGIDHLLDAPKQQGELSLFYEPKMGSLTGEVSYKNQLSRLFSGSLDYSFQNDSGYGVTSSSSNGDLTFRYDTASSQSLLGFQRSVVSTDTSSSTQFTTNLTHQERLGTDGDWSFRSTYHNSQYSANVPATETLETELRWRRQFPAYAVSFLAQKQYDLSAPGATATSAYVLNRVPDLALTTQSERLGNRRLFGSAFEATGYVGYFQQEPDDTNVYRTGLDLRLPGHVQQLGGRATLRTSARFQQMFFSDGSAQWLGDVESEYNLQLTRSWQSRLTFSYLKPNGFSPLRQDSYSPTSVLYWEAVRLVPDRMRLDFTFGRDFHNSLYQDAIVRAEIMLTPRNRIEMQSGYSIELAQWRPINLRWVYATQRAWWSAVTVNYDLAATDLTDVSFDIDWLPAAKWRLQLLAGYSGAGGLDQADVRVTRDLHCMLATLSYAWETREIRFGLGIKAFPSDTRTFGVGGRGQYFESNFSDQY